MPQSSADLKDITKEQLEPKAKCQVYNLVHTHRLPSKPKVHTHRLPSKPKVHTHRLHSKPKARHRPHGSVPMRGRLQ